MKKVLICSVAILSILLANDTALTKEQAKARNIKRQTRVASEKKKLSEEEKRFRETLKTMTPEQRQLALAKRTFEKSLISWQEVRKIAVEEKAAKTVAAIDKIIADKQAQFKKKLETMKKEGVAKGDKTKGEGKRREGQKPERKKKQSTE